MIVVNSREKINERSKEECLVVLLCGLSSLIYREKVCFQNARDQ